MTLKTSIDTLVADAAIAHDIIHGADDETVTTEGGPVPSLAKAIADMVAYWGTLGMTLASAGTISAAPGTVGAPSLIWGGDLTTGIYRIGANNLGVAVSGAKVLDISSAGAAVTGNLSASAPAGTAAVTAIASSAAVGATQFYAVGYNGGYGAGITMGAPASGGATVAMAKIVADGTAAWTSTASTQDARLSFHTTTDGVLTQVGTWDTNGLGVTGKLYASGAIALASTQKLYLDGVAATGDTYLAESSANILDFYAGGVRSMYLGSSGARFTSGDGTYQIGVVGTTKGIRMGTNSSLAFIQGVDSTLGASYQPLLLSGSRVDFDMSGTTQFNTIAGGIGKPATTGYLALTGGITPSSDGATIYLSGAAYGTPNKAYIDSAAVDFRNISGASTYASIISTGIALPATNRLHMDGIAGTGDTYLVESSANVFDLYVGGAVRYRASTKNELVGNAEVTGILGVTGCAVLGQLTPAASAGLYIRQPMTGATTFAIAYDGTIGSDALTVSYGFYARPGTAAASFTLPNYYSFFAGNIQRSSATITNQYGFYVEPLNNATTNIGLRSLVAANAGSNWNIYADGTAPNYLGGDLVLGSTKKLRFDTNYAGDTYIVESSANVLDLYAGGTKQLSVTATGVTVGLDGSSANSIKGVVGHTTTNSATGFNMTGATTGWTGYRVANTSGALFMGVASSAGTLFTGSTAYSSGIGTEGNYPLEFATNGTVRASISGAGNVTFNGDVRLATRTPASASATGTTGTVAWDANYLYVCTATDTWKRAALATW